MRDFEDALWFNIQNRVPGGWQLAFRRQLPDSMSNADRRTSEKLFLALYAQGCVPCDSLSDTQWNLIHIAIVQFPNDAALLDRIETAILEMHPASCCDCDADDATVERKRWTIYGAFRMARAIIEVADEVVAEPVRDASIVRN